MKNVRLNSKKLMAVLLTGFILITVVGCANQKTDSKNNHQQQTGYIETTEETKESNNITQNNSTEDKTTSKENINLSEEENIVENSTNKIFTNDDIEVINYFNKIEADIDNELKKENSKAVKDKLKGTFITIVDFLFYDSEINGIKFDDLTEGAKQNILETVSSIDNKIMVKYPTYKEDISSTTSKAYNKASELIKKGANNIKDFSKEKLGEDNYNSIIEAKDELVYYTKNAVNIIGDVAGSVWETSKSKIKTWYENFRN